MFKFFFTKFKIFIKLNLFYRFSEKYRGIKSIIPNDVIIGDNVIIESNVDFSSNCIVGKHTYIGNDSKIFNCNRIGNFTSISSGVRIGLIQHHLNFISTSPIFYSKKRGWSIENNLKKSLPVEIGNDVLISMNVLIQPGVKIGDGAVIGAGSFVNKDVPPYAIVAGVPAKLIRYRFNDSDIKLLLDSKWWDEKDELLMKNLNLASSPISFINNISEVKRNNFSS